MDTGNQRREPDDSTSGSAEAWLDRLQWDENGLVPAIAQDAATRRVLMLAWMNRESLLETTRTGRAVYWSRSRRRLWRKGEESGNQQLVQEIRTDCDADVILLTVEQRGGVACHTGRESCFFNKLDEAHRWEVVDAVKVDPARLYGAGDANASNANASGSSSETGPDVDSDSIGQLALGIGLGISFGMTIGMSIGRMW